MNIEEYKDTYKIPLGAKVIIKECHSQPAVVGKSGKVCAWLAESESKYPLLVKLDEPVNIPTNVEGLFAQYQGPHYCRPDELEQVLDVPEVFNFEDTEVKDDAGDKGKE
jgi:hypothetical protein